MAISKNSVTILTSTAVTSGSSKTAPGATGSSVNCTSYYGGEIGYKITNGSGAPSTALSLTFQSSHDGTNWYDYQTVAGDTTASSVNSGSLLLDRGVMYLRAIAYGNVLNTVTVEAYLQAVTGL
jgi:hypothetical protein